MTKPLTKTNDLAKQPASLTSKSIEAGTLSTQTNVFHDMHCHLDFARDAQSFSREAAAHGSHIFANTVTPKGFSQAKKLLDGFPTVHLGLGLHPWYIKDVDEQVETFLASLNTTNFIGEIGLDFSKRKLETAPIQQKAVGAILNACGEQGGKLISLHAIHSANTVLDMLEETGTLESCTCIFHWFSGSNDELRRAIDHGCYFSVGPFMANSRRGYEYIKVIPTAQLLLETDYPPTGDGVTIDQETGEPRVDLSYREVNEALLISAQKIVERKGRGTLEEINATSLKLFGQYSK